MAAPFDPIKLEVGLSFPLIEGIATTFGGLAQYVMTPSGTLYHAAGAASGSGYDDVALVHVGMDGTVDPLPVQTGTYRGEGGSPDGQRIALIISDSLGRSVFEGSLWVLDVRRDILTPLPAGSAVRQSGDVGGRLLWSPDGEWIYYAATPEDGSGRALHRIRADGSGAGEPISGGDGLSPTSISADGKRLYANRGTGGEVDIVVVHLDEDSRVEEVIAAPGRQNSGAISPDGAWLAYVVGAPGAQQVYISSADGQGGRKQVSRDSGSNPAWSPDGTKLYFNTERTRMVVEVKTPTAAEGVSLSVGDLEPSPPEARFVLDSSLARPFELTPDGEEFLTFSLGNRGQGGEVEVIDEIIVTLNFSKELERLVSDQNK